jgi:hypothetical protein
VEASQAGSGAETASMATVAVGGWNFSDMTFLLAPEP